MPFLESVGRSAIEKVEYVGGLSIQFWRALRSAWKANPFTGSRLRWRSTIDHMRLI